MRTSATKLRFAIISSRGGPVPIRFYNRYFLGVSILFFIFFPLSAFPADSIPSSIDAAEATPAMEEGQMEAGGVHDGPTHARDRFIVAFRDTLTVPADVVHGEAGRTFSAAADKKGADLDGLNKKHGVRAIRPLFSSLMTEGGESRDLPRGTALPSSIGARKKNFHDRVLKVRKRFPLRSGRVGGEAVIPDLTSIYVVELAGPADIPKICGEYAANENVRYAIPIGAARAQAVPNDPFYLSSGSWGQPFDDLWALKKVGAEEAWNTATGSGIVVAVIDTGVDYAHQDMAANIWSNSLEAGGASGVDDDGNGFVDDIRGWDFANNDNNPMDDNFHGTHVAGTIAAVGNNGIGTVGLAHGALIMPVKGLDMVGYGHFDVLAKALVYAAQNGADVINNSWAFFQRGPDQLLEDAVAFAHGLGALVTFAAGNTYDSVGSVYPSRIPDVLTVGATGMDDNVAPYSNKGHLLDLTAPGGTDYSILSLRATGRGSTALVVASQYLRLHGTSMATPFVSGAAALVLERNPLLTREEVIAILRHSADDQVGPAETDTPGYDPHFGWGRLNVTAAVASALAPPADPPVLEVHPAAVTVTVPRSACAGPSLSLPLGIYNLGGGVLDWTTSSPQWMSAAPLSGTKTSTTRLTIPTDAARQGTIAIQAAGAQPPAKDIPVEVYEATGLAMTNCDMIITAAPGTQGWDPAKYNLAGPPVVSDGKGGAIYVWVDGNATYGPELYAQKVDDRGAPLWPQNGVQVTTSVPGTKIHPVLTSDGAGGVIVAWTEGKNDAEIFNKHIQAQRINGSGDRVWGANGVWLGPGRNNQIKPAITDDGSGGAVIAWLDYRGGAADVYAQRIGGDGVVKWAADGVPVVTAGDAQFSPDLISVVDGGVIVAWQDKRSGYSSTYVQILDRNGLARLAADGVLVGMADLATSPKVVADGAGGAIVLWHDFRYLTSQPSPTTVFDRSDIHATRIDGAGNFLWPRTGVAVTTGRRVGPYRFQPGWQPSQIIAMADGAGGVIISWLDARNSSWDIYAQRLNGAGAALWAAGGVPVVAAAHNQFSPSLASDGAGGAVLAWTDYRSGEGDIYVQRLNQAGEPLWGPDGAWIMGSAVELKFPSIVSLAGGRFAVSWDDWRNCPGNICGGSGVDLRGQVLQMISPCVDGDLDGAFAGGPDCVPLDCNDADPAIHPGALEIPYNSIDENCNGMADDADFDLDGYPPPMDCNDADPAVNPGAAEVPYNGVDDDCSAATPDDDLDGDGYPLVTDCNDQEPEIHPAAAEICNDSVDNNCDGVLDAADPLCVTKCSANVDCTESGTFCAKAPNDCAAAGICEKIPADPCPQVSDPVCGCDGKTYPGACDAERAGVAVSSSGECVAEYLYYFPAVNDDESRGWRNYLTVQAKDAVAMDCEIRVHDLGGQLKGRYVYGNAVGSQAPPLAPNQRVAQRPAFIAGSEASPVPVEGSLIVRTNVPAVASINTIANSYEGFNIYESAKPKAAHLFPKNYDGPTRYQVHYFIQNIHDTPRPVTIALTGKKPGDPGDGRSHRATIAPYGTLKIRPGLIAGNMTAVVDFDGSGTVTVDDGLPVAAMCRYELGAEALSIYESVEPRPSLFFPMIRDGKFGGPLDYQNHLSVVNPGGMDAVVAVVLHNKYGIEVGRSPEELIPGGGKRTWRPSMIRGSVASPVDFEGSVRVLATAAVVGQTNVIYPGENAYNADAFDIYESAMPSETLYFPKAFDNKAIDGRLFENTVFIQNPDDRTKLIDVVLRDNSGKDGGRISAKRLRPFATLVFQPRDLALDGSRSFQGSIRIVEQQGRSITGCIQYELRAGEKASDPVDAMTVYRSMGR